MLKHKTKICLIAALISSTAAAVELNFSQPTNNKVELNIQPNTEASIIDTILQVEGGVVGTTTLVVDDGVPENSIGDSGQFIWLNRFTPEPSEFPFMLEEVSVIFGTTLGR